MTTGSVDEIGVGVVGLGWMGQVHARALGRLAQHYPDAPLRPRLVSAAEADDERLATVGGAYGFEHLTTRWHDLVGRDDVDLVCVTGPNFLHRDVAVASAAAGKHIWVEKPAGRDLGETREIADAVAAAGVQCATGFNYRNAPAVELAKALVGDGRLGTVEHVLVRFLADYAAHPDGALSWRFVHELAGSGVLGDLVSHATDLARFVVGDIRELVADDARFVPQRPEAAGATSHFARAAGGPPRQVENEDYAAALLRFDGGARGMLEASRVAVGAQSAYELEVHGTAGALAWDFRRMGELRVCLDQDYQNASYATTYATPQDGELGSFQPGAGIAMGYDDLKVIEALRLVRSIAEGRPQGATIADAVVAARTVEAVGESLATRAWVTL